MTGNQEDLFLTLARTGIMNEVTDSPSKLTKIKRALKNNFRDIFQRPVGQYESIDGLRALSVYFVIVFHCFYFTARLLPKDLVFGFIDSIPSYLNWVWHGDKGVDIFFVISGFLVGGIIFREYEKHGKIHFKKFYFRRIFRIVPVYILALMLFMLVDPGNAKYVWANLLFINNFLPASWLLAPHSWSITVEVQFYLVFPLFFLFILRPRSKKILLLLLVFILASVIRGALLLQEPDLYTTQIYENFLNLGGNPGRFAEVIYGNLYTRFGPLILGVLLAYLHTHHHHRVSRFVTENIALSSVIFIFGLTVLIVTSNIPYHNPASFYSKNYDANINLLMIATNRNLFSLGVAIILFFCLYPIGITKPVKQFLSSKFLLPIAKTSYSIYLFHAPVLVIAAVLVHGVDIKPADVTTASLIATSMLTLFLSWLLSILVYITLEKPAIDWNKNREKQRAA